MKKGLFRASYLVSAMLFAVTFITVSAPKTVDAEAAEDLNTGLIGWWKFNEGSGTSAEDSSSNNNHGTFVNSSFINWVTSDVPSCDASNNSYLSFDGPTDSNPSLSDGGYVNVGDINDLKPGSVTISAWVKRPVLATSHDPAPIAGTVAFNEANYGYGLHDNGGNSIGSSMYGIAPIQADISSDVDVWIHMTSTYDENTGVFSLYKNGTLAESNTDLTPEPINYDDAVDFRIGAGSYDPLYFGGGIDDVRVYNRALSASEVEDLAQTSTGCASADDSDGVDSSTESSSPNGGDANDDGTPDNQQTKVTSLPSPVNGEYIVLESSTCSANTAVQINNEPVPADQDDDNYEYPLGLLSFNLTGCSVGGVETITQYYYGDYDVSKIALRKYDPSNHSYKTIDNAVITKVSIGGKNAIKAVYTVTDGGELDADNTANGTIVDPAGIGLLGVSAPETGLNQANNLLYYLVILAGVSILITSYRFKKLDSKN